MIEELFIYINGEREQMDLKTPSGITLSYESNLFNALDRVNCSRSYTFNLPMTRNNRRVFGLADDIRSNGARVGQRFKAEYIVNGVNLCPNANIYINDIAGTYNAVMTWGIIDGLKDLQNSKINISDLETETESGTIDHDFVCTPKEKPDVTTPIDFDKPMFPFYEAGVPKESANYPKTGWILPIYNAYPLPVISVKWLLTRINQKFATKILQNNDGSFYSDAVIQRGVVPDIKVQLTPQQSKMLSSVFQSPSCNARGIVSFGNITNNSHGQYTIENQTFGYVKPARYSNMAFVIEGHLGVNPSYVQTATRKPVFLCISRGIPNSSTISNDWDNEERIESAFDLVDGQKVYRYEWNLSETLGTDVQVSYKYTDFMNAVVFHFEDEDGNTCPNVTFTTGGFGTQLITIYPRWEEGVAPHMMDAIFSLPEISCFEFVKSLFYMIGAFPVVGESGNIIPAYYTDIITNLQSGNVYDWSKYVVNNDQNPKKIEWRVGGFAQRNLYRMKSADENQNNGEDVFADGVAVVDVANGLLNEENVVVTLPYYAPFLMHGKRPALPTGNTMKYWRLNDEGELTAEPAQPIFGFVDETNEMRCFNFPDDVNLGALRQMVGTPRVIVVELKIDEYSLKNISYIKPVYLEQYSSYFAIIKIERTSNGICNAELLKINL